jgi:oligopeptide/dipeptide ABC transporter ATP-binding protein
VRTGARLLEVHGLSVAFDTPTGPVHVLEDVGLELAAGETLGLVGESGSGKTVTALAILDLLPPGGRVTAGRVFLEERNLLRLAADERRALRGRAMAMVFQDPLSALHPMLTVGLQLSEVLEHHEGLGRRAARERAIGALGEVGIPAPERAFEAHPHQLSGGQRQRVLLAMALLLRPRVLFADEPTTALDVTVQAQVLDLIASLQQRHGTGVVLVTHDLGVVAGRCDRVQVLYAGRTAEVAATRALFARPLHPYTRGLIASVPRLDGPEGRVPAAIGGQPPDWTRRASGCAFHPRCPLTSERCRRELPGLDPVPGQHGRRAACFESVTLGGRS